MIILIIIITAVWLIMTWLFISSFFIGNNTSQEKNKKAEKGAQSELVSIVATPSIIPHEDAIAAAKELIEKVEQRKMERQQAQEQAEEVETEITDQVEIFASLSPNDRQEIETEIQQLPLNIDVINDFSTPQRQEILLQQEVIVSSEDPEEQRYFSAELFNSSAISRAMDSVKNHARASFEEKLAAGEYFTAIQNTELYDKFCEFVEQEEENIEEIMQEFMQVANANINININDQI